MSAGCTHSRTGGLNVLNYDTFAVTVRDPYELLKEHPGAKDEMENRLCIALRKKNYKIAERQETDRILAEHVLGQSGITDENIPELGKAVNAQALLLIDVTKAKISESLLEKIPHAIDGIMNIFGKPVDNSRQQRHRSDEIKSFASVVKFNVKLIDVEKFDRVWTGEFSSGDLVFSNDDLGDAHLKAIDNLGEKFPIKQPEKTVISNQN